MILVPKYLYEARKQFAAANGWTVSKPNFSPWAIAHDKVRDPHDTVCHPLGFDHPEYFRKDGRAVAITGHNYDDDCRACETAVQDRLALHIAPHGAAASWYYPNHATLIVMTRPGIEVVWPTVEEMVENAARHAVFAVKRRGDDSDNQYVKAVA